MCYLCILPCEITLLSNAISIWAAEETVWLPYEITLLACHAGGRRFEFDYHMKLHYSQTQIPFGSFVCQFDYHMKLHYSQTTIASIHNARQVWLPYEITLLSNNDSNQHQKPPVWLPYEITLLSNRFAITRPESLVWLPYEITLLSNTILTVLLRWKSLTTIWNYTTLKPFNAGQLIPF